jgi:hypothetical protein
MATSATTQAQRSDAVRCPHPREIDVVGCDTALEVEHRNSIAATVDVVYLVAEEDRSVNSDPSLLFDLAPNGVLDGLTILQGATEAGPAPGMENPRFVIA